MMEKVNTENVTARTAARWGLMVALLTIPLAIVVGHFVDQGRGMAAGLALALMIGAVRAFWYLRRHPWFWISVATLVIIHIVLIIFVPWNNKSFPAPAVWPVAIADFAAQCGFLKLVEKSMRRSDGTASGS